MKVLSVPTKKAGCTKYFTFIFPSWSLGQVFWHILPKLEYITQCVMHCCVTNYPNTGPLTTRVSIDCSPSFCGSGIQEQLDWAVPFGDLLMLLRSWWQLLECEASAPHLLGLSTGLFACLKDTAALFPQSEWSRKEEDGSGSVFYSIASEVTLFTIFLLLLTCWL